MNYFVVDLRTVCTNWIKMSVCVLKFQLPLQSKYGKPITRESSLQGNPYGKI